MHHLIRRGHYCFNWWNWIQEREAPCCCYRFCVYLRHWHLPLFLTMSHDLDNPLQTQMANAMSKGTNHYYSKKIRERKENLIQEDVSCSNWNWQYIGHGVSQEWQGTYNEEEIAACPRYPNWGKLINTLRICTWFGCLTWWSVLWWYCEEPNSNREDLTELITTAEFHSIHCNLLACSSSRGSIQLVDLQQ